MYRYARIKSRMRRNASDYEFRDSGEKLLRYCIDLGVGFPTYGRSICKGAIRTNLKRTVKDIGLFLNYKKWFVRAVRCLNVSQGFKLSNLN